MTGRTFHLRRAADGSWLVNPQPPLAATTSFLVGGWEAVAALRTFYDAVDWFPETKEFEAFCRQFGSPPRWRDDPEAGESYLSALDALATAVADHAAAVDRLRALAEARGQGDHALPLVVRSGDVELKLAIDAEVASMRAVEAARARIAGTR